MDLGTLIGIVLGMILVVGSMAMGSPLSSFVNAAGLLIVVGGTIAATLINESLSRVMGAVKVCMQAFFDKKQSIDAMIDQIVIPQEMTSIPGGIFEMPHPLHRILPSLIFLFL